MSKNKRAKMTEKPSGYGAYFDFGATLRQAADKLQNNMDTLESTSAIRTPVGSGASASPCRVLWIPIARGPVPPINEPMNDRLRIMRSIPSQLQTYLPC